MIWWFFPCTQCNCFVSCHVSLTHPLTNAWHTHARTYKRTMSLLFGFLNMMMLPHRLFVVLVKCVMEVFYCQNLFCKFFKPIEQCNTFLNIELNECILSSFVILCNYFLAVRYWTTFTCVKEQYAWFFKFGLIIYVKTTKDETFTVISTTDCHFHHAMSFPPQHMF